MKTQDTAINYIYQLMTGSEASHDVDNVFKWAKPTKEKLSEYIVINALPVTAGVMQFVRVNVNFFAADLYAGVPDTERLEAVTADLMTDLEQIDDTGIYVDFESQEYIREASTGFHFSNIRLNVKMIN
jgi:hypothetical protein